MSKDKTEKISVEQYRAMVASGSDTPPAKVNKFGAIPTRVDGIRFDSKAEARRYSVLKLLVAAGEISDLRIHPQFTLQEAYTTPKAERVSAIRYTADFQYRQEGHIVVEDVKGARATQTQDFKTRSRLFKDQNPHIEFKIIG